MATEYDFQDGRSIKAAHFYLSRLLYLKVVNKGITIAKHLVLGP